MATASGLSIDTIRYYERSGLCPTIARGVDGKRNFSSKDAEWLTLLSSLRETGMPMSEMRRFAQLYRKGDATVSQRKTMLLEHSLLLEVRQAAVERCRELLAFKLDRYEELLGETA